MSTLGFFSFLRRSCTEFGKWMPYLIVTIRRISNDRLQYRFFIYFTCNLKNKSRKCLFLVQIYESEVILNKTPQNAATQIWVWHAKIEIWTISELQPISLFMQYIFDVFFFTIWSNIWHKMKKWVLWDFSHSYGVHGRNLENGCHI